MAQTTFRLGEGKFDAAFSESAEVGFGMMLRDDQGKLVAVASFFAGSQLDVAVAEALCLKWSIQLCRNLLCCKIIFDCLAITQEWAAKSPANTYFADIIQQCNRLTTCFQDCSIKYTPRDCNKPADFLSKLAYS